MKFFVTVKACVYYFYFTHQNKTYQKIIKNYCYLLLLIFFFAKYTFFKMLSSNLQTSNLGGNLKKV